MLKQLLIICAILSTGAKEKYYFGVGEKVEWVSNVKSEFGFFLCDSIGSLQDINEYEYEFNNYEKNLTYKVIFNCRAFRDDGFITYQTKSFWIKPADLRKAIIK